jgi:23S rRNA (guanosine2251-2'-O)-methyltransferase
MVESIHAQGPAVFLILHNIRSAYNVGAIFRTADAAGVSRIYLAGYTPAPVDRFGRKRADIHKAALGAEDTVAWEAAEDTVSLCAHLRNEGVLLVAVEQAPRALDHRTLKRDRPTALVFGNEVDGLSEDMVNICDLVVEIPMHGTKESLNVSVAVGVVLYGMQ